MKLLLDRGQKTYKGISILPLRFGSGVVFTIKAQLEVEPDERDLIDRYNLRSAVIANGSFWETLKIAFPQAVLVTLLSAIIVLPLFSFVSLISRSLSNHGTTVLGLIFCVLLYLYYKDAKEEILVSDLLNNWRTFRADTVVDLVHKETYIESVSQYLQQLLVTSEHWTDRGSIEIKPLEKSMAKLAILRAIK